MISSKSQSIYKFRELPRSEDFNFLRQRGLEYIKKLGSSIWTDYNLHDPGITILEVLCYALTDLGYRTHFDIKDLLARQSGDSTQDFFTAAQILSCNPVTINDFRKLIIDQPGIQNGWLTLAQEPVFYYKCSDSDRSYSIKLQKPDTGDFQDKELTGLYNVALQLEDDDELGDLNSRIIDWSVTIDERKVPVRIVLPPIEVGFPGWHSPIIKIHQQNEILPASFEQTGTDPRNYTLTFDDQTPEKISIPNVRLVFTTPDDIQEQAIINAFTSTINTTVALAFHQFLFRRFKQILERIQQVYCALHQHRNLCEDFIKFRLVPSQDVAICVDIAVKPEANLEEVLAQIYFKIDQFLAPPVHFHSLQEMRDRGRSIDEIFEGPYLEHGFIDDQDLHASTLKQEIHTSDIYQLIMAIDEVISVKDLLITHYLDGMAQTDGDRWHITLDKDYHLNVRIDQSKVTFYKGIVPRYADKMQVDRLFQTLKAEHSKLKSRQGDHDVPIPQGTYQDLSQYVSIQNDFPLVYGVGQAGLPSTASDLRKAQAKQLKAFLMFFDQLLANYLAQLTQVKNLFAIQASNEVQHTCAIQPLYKQPDEPDQSDFPGVEDLLIPFLDSAGVSWDDFRRNQENEYLKSLQEAAESESQFLDRRNRILDHLLARFAESFSDYAVLMYRLEGKDSLEELVQDKERFLHIYPEISRDRGKAFQLQCHADLASNSTPVQNVSGLQKRLCKLLGINDSSDRSFGFSEIEILQVFEISSYEEAGKVTFGFTLKIDNEPVLESQQRYPQDPNPQDVQVIVKQAIYQVIYQAADPNNYQITRNQQNQFDLALKGSRDQILAHYPSTQPLFNSEEAAQEKVQAIAQFIQERYAPEGMHLIEHILLRPVKDQEISHTDVVQDGFIPECQQENDCSCPIKDYYSCRMTIVLPYWPVRFRSMDFREFAERTIRQETPAHILAKICWIDVPQMKNLEDKHKIWQEAINANPPRQNQVSDAIKSLVKTINTLTTIYPEGILHDCTKPTIDDDVIILDQTRLGTFEDIETE